MLGETKTGTIFSGNPELYDHPLPPHELHLGRHEYGTALYDSFIALPQIREHLPAAPAELRQSIFDSGLDNPPNVAIVNDEELSAYLEFVNNRWKSRIAISDLESHRQANGRFNLVVAGHQRMLSIQEEADHYTRVTGLKPEWTVDYKILQDNRVYAIVAKQYSENLHSRPKKEREAMAVVEMYHCGLGTVWNNPDEFLLAPESKTLGRKMLNEALAFAALPEGVQLQVFSGYTTYDAGIMLGKLMPVLRDYCAAKVGLTAADQLSIETEKEIVYLIQGYTTHIYSNKLKGAALRSYVQGIKTARHADTVAWRGTDLGSDDIPAGKDVPMVRMATAADQARIELRRAERARARELQAMLAKPIAAATHAYTLFEGEVRTEVEESIVADATQAQQRLIRAIAKPGLRLVEPELSDEDLLFDTEVVADHV